MCDSTLAKELQQIEQSEASKKEKEEFDQLQVNKYPSFLSRSNRWWSSPEVACWLSDHWVDGSNPLHMLRGMFHHCPLRLLGLV